MSLPVQSVRPKPASRTGASLRRHGTWGPERRQRLDGCGIDPRIGLLRRPTGAHQRRHTPCSRYARRAITAGGYRPCHVRNVHAGTIRDPSAATGRSTGGAAERGTTPDAASRMGVGRSHSIWKCRRKLGDWRRDGRGDHDGTGEGPDTCSGNPGLPNPPACEMTGQTICQTLVHSILHHVDFAALERAFRRQRRPATRGRPIDCGRVRHHWKQPSASCTRESQRTILAQAGSVAARHICLGGKRRRGPPAARIPPLEDRIVQARWPRCECVYEADFLVSATAYGRGQPHPLAALEEDR